MSSSPKFCPAVSRSGTSERPVAALTIRGPRSGYGHVGSCQDNQTSQTFQVRALHDKTLIQLLEEACDFIDVLVTGDDLGEQKSTLISPKMYRRMVKPLHVELMTAIKQRTKAKIFYHSDGNIYSLLGDLVEIGVDLLNPVQVNVGDMGDTARLKREFGDRLAFCGAIDTGWVLPFGTPEDVRVEVRRRIKDLAPGGGYILASVHCIQPDVPLENVIAMLDEAKVAGQYPLRF